MKIRSGFRMSVVGGQEKGILRCAISNTDKSEVHPDSICGDHGCRDFCVINTVISRGQIIPHSLQRVLLQARHLCL